MNQKQFQESFAIAKDTNISLNSLDLCVFDGYGLPNFTTITTTILSVAALIRWQAMYIGHPKDEPGPMFDEEQLDNIRRIGRHKFMIAG